MKKAMGSRLFKRFHIIPRASAERFHEVVRLADVLLHPFPFDGSRSQPNVFVIVPMFLVQPLYF